MNLSDYVIDLLLIALVLRQIRRQTLTPGSIILPTVLIIVAGLNKDRSVELPRSETAVDQAVPEHQLTR